MVQRFLRMPALIEATGRSRSWIYHEIKAGRFPRPLKGVGQRAAVWVESEIAAWQRAQIVARDSAEAA